MWYEPKKKTRRCKPKYTLPRCFDRDATMIQASIIDQMVWFIVDSSAAIQCDESGMNALLKTSAISKNVHAIQPVDFQWKRAKLNCARSSFENRRVLHVSRMLLVVANGMQYKFQFPNEAYLYPNLTPTPTTYLCLTNKETKLWPRQSRLLVSREQMAYLQTKFGMIRTFLIVAKTSRLRHSEHLTPFGLRACNQIELIGVIFNWCRFCSRTTP